MIPVPHRKVIASPSRHTLWVPVLLAGFLCSFGLGLLALIRL